MELIHQVYSNHLQTIRHSSNQLEQGLVNSQSSCPYHLYVSYNYATINLRLLCMYMLYDHVY